MAKKLTTKYLKSNNITELYGSDLHGGVACFELQFDSDGESSVWCGGDLMDDYTSVAEFLADKEGGVV